MLAGSTICKVMLPRWFFLEKIPDKDQKDHKGVLSYRNRWLVMELVGR